MTGEEFAKAGFLDCWYHARVHVYTEYMDGIEGKAGAKMVVAYWYSPQWMSLYATLSSNHYPPTIFVLEEGGGARSMDELSTLRARIRRKKKLMEPMPCLSHFFFYSDGSIATLSTSLVLLFLLLLQAPNFHPWLGLRTRLSYIIS